MKPAAQCGAWPGRAVISCPCFSYLCFCGRQGSSGDEVQSKVHAADVILVSCQRKVSIPESSLNIRRVGALSTRKPLSRPVHPCQPAPPALAKYLPTLTSYPFRDIRVQKQSRPFLLLFFCPFVWQTSLVPRRQMKEYRVKARAGLEGGKGAGEAFPEQTGRAFL